ncbi:pentatricopeptide repeat-containing protein At4g33170-like [Phragmites australis]|uniref:pentatricopeptide repeat-containing protein At4g33170-like n=1 Tax=Phragmites australis TaxID=29695 RepID=UPI002D76EA28|nr:pentatricopeptide repeat-containing protein At4g33170-like [Phragmites australis]
MPPRAPPFAPRRPPLPDSVKPRSFHAAATLQHEPVPSYRYAALLQRSAAAADHRLAASLHAALHKSGLLASHLFLCNHLLIAYFRSRLHRHGLRLLDEMPRRNAVSWSAAIAGLAQGDRPRDALALFRRMRSARCPPNEFALVSALNASSFVGGAGAGRARQLYALAVRLGFESNVFLMNAFLAAMVRHGQLADAVQLFDSSCARDIVSWNTLLAGFARHWCVQVWILWRRMAREVVGADGFSFSTVLSGLAASVSLGSGLQVHAQLVKSGFGADAYVGNSLVEMYMKNKCLVDGTRAFTEIRRRDVVSWTEMAAGCLHCGEPAKAIGVLSDMMLDGVMPNNFTFATAANACALLTNLDQGRKVHGCVIKLGDDSDVGVNNALIDMYAKCGSVSCAYSVFQSMQLRPVISWTSMIMGFAQNGRAREAVDVFDDMLLEGVTPNHVTLICLLYACSQGGFVNEGWIYFNAMKDKFGVEPREDHYACMVHLLGKAGHIEEAEELISQMPFRPGVLVWQALLGACHLHGNEAAGKRAAEHALALEKEDPSTYMLLSNMLAGRQNWDGAGSARRLMGDTEIMKLPGSTWFQSKPDGNKACIR